MSKATRTMNGGAVSSKMRCIVGMNGSKGNMVLCSDRMCGVAKHLCLSCYSKAGRS